MTATARVWLTGTLLPSARSAENSGTRSGTRLVPQIELVLTTGESTWHEDQLVPITRNGRVEDVYWTYSYSPVREDDDGSVCGVLVTVQETTSRVQLLAAERSARQRAERADAAKSQFLATMSHELRTPLNAIQGHVQLIEMGLYGPVTAEQTAALARIDRAQQHLLGLINNVLNFARLDSGQVRCLMKDIDLQDIIAAVMPMIEPQLADKRLSLEVLLPEGKICVVADQEKLTQVLLNLLSNAIKFTPACGRVTIEVGHRADGTQPDDALYLRVADTGIGIPREKLDVVFEPFVQINTDLTSVQQGTGLGLAISRDLARAMDGDLRARSVLARRYRHRSRYRSRYRFNQSRIALRGWSRLPKQLRYRWSELLRASGL